MIQKLSGKLLIAAVLVALVVGGAAIAGASGPDQPAAGQATPGVGATDRDEAAESGGRDDDAGESAEQVRNREAAGRARTAALKAAGGGTATEVDLADEGEGGYEVEVRRRDGSYAEVHVDRGFGVVSVQSDDD